MSSSCPNPNGSSLRFHDLFDTALREYLLSTQETGKKIMTDPLRARLIRLALSLVPQKFNCQLQYDRGSTVALLKRVPDMFWCPEGIIILCILSCPPTVIRMSPSCRVSAWFQPSRFRIVGDLWASLSTT